MKRHLNFIVLFFLLIMTFVVKTMAQTDEIHIAEVINEDQYKFTLNGISPKDSIYIFNRTSLYYKFVDLQEQNVEIRNISFILDNQDITPLYQNKYVDIYPIDLIESGSTLEIIISLADNLQQVKYQYKILRLDNYNISMEQDITSDNHLKIIWNKLPEYKTLKIEKYILSFRDEYTKSDVKKEIVSTDTFYIDNTYAYGDRKYRLEAVFFKNDPNLTYTNNFYTYYYVEYEKYTEQDFIFSNVDANRVKIEWKKNRYDCVYYLEYRTWDDYSTTNQHNECSIEFNRDIFPLDARMEMYIIPSIYDVSTKQNITPIYYNYHDPILFAWDRPKYKWGNTFDINKKIIYFTNEKGLYSFDLNTMAQISKVNFDKNHSAHISCSRTDSRIALNIQDNIQIYNDANLANPFTFQGNNAFYDSYPNFYIAGNFVVTCNSYDGKAYIYDSHTGINLYTIPFDYNTTNVLLSPDGNYLVTYEPVYYGTLKIYRLTNEKYTLIHSANDWYVDYCEFDQQDIDILYLVNKYGNGYSAFSISKLSVIMDYNTNFGRIDPFTGNRVCFERDNEDFIDYYVVYNNTKDQVLYKIKYNHSSSNVEIFNNILFANTSGWPTNYYYLNLNELMQKGTGFVEPSLSKSHILIYPNPIHNSFFIDHDDFCEIRIYNMLGNKVLTQNVNGKTEINISHFAKGIYSVIILSEGKVIGNNKIVKL